MGFRKPALPAMAAWEAFWAKFRLNPRRGSLGPLLRESISVLGRLKEACGHQKRPRASIPSGGSRNSPYPSRDSSAFIAGRASAREPLGSRSRARVAPGSRVPRARAVPSSISRRTTTRGSPRAPRAHDVGGFRGTRSFARLTPRDLAEDAELDPRCGPPDSRIERLCGLWALPTHLFEADPTRRVDPLLAGSVRVRGVADFARRGAEAGPLPVVYDRGGYAHRYRKAGLSTRTGTRTGPA